MGLVQLDVVIVSIETDIRDNSIPGSGATGNVNSGNTFNGNSCAISSCIITKAVSQSSRNSSGVIAGSLCVSYRSIGTNFNTINIAYSTGSDCDRGSIASHRIWILGCKNRLNCSFKTSLSIGFGPQCLVLGLSISEQRINAFKFFTSTGNDQLSTINFNDSAYTSSSDSVGTVVSSRRSYTIGSR